MATVEAALAVAERGWHLYPLAAKTKLPCFEDPWEKATTAPETIRKWWKRYPGANIGFAPGRTGHTVVDVDYGLTDEASLRKFLSDRDIPETFAVRTGRRPEFRVQLYFEGSIEKSFNGWKDQEFAGDVRGPKGHVAAVGSVHPDSGELYEVLWDKPLAPVSKWVKELRRYVDPSKPEIDLGAPIDSWRNENLFRVLSELRRKGATDIMVDTFARMINDDSEQMPTPLDESELETIIGNVQKLAKGGPEIEVTIGKPKEPEKPKFTDWREMFHTLEELENMPDPVFLIDGFLQEESITGLIGPARARKSIVSLNVMHALLTGEKLFGQFEVVNKPSRVVYLCPESGVKSLWKRIRNLGLAQFIGKSLFFTSMNSEKIPLTDPLLLEATKDSVVFIDTAIRFFDGDENSAQDMKLFANQCQALVRMGGVRAVILLHHTSKSAEGLTLEGGRGSGDFGGFLTCCWATTLDDYENAYTSESLMSCVKQRDFQADNFKVAPSGNADNFFLQYIEGSENAKVQVGAKAKSGKAAAEAFTRANADMTGEQLAQALRAEGIADYSVTSCRNMLRDVRGKRKVNQQ